ncbi:AraC family transcriptional regulator ligand-binding domain-containing protein [Roseateles sp. SL47]|uniref:AraC family transcriptional regulator n=1 Tax=Roseateles sp. SL47 TaxID=2995138 RepID=UPI00226FFCD0|nr:AraC family transcriptional regulator [Roseateles sp. SL47]WAC73857.1 AraC family transcriptional regulator ligand-binding domain-containing protein [Roseateles sp. SL47]
MSEALALLRSSLPAGTPPHYGADTAFIPWAYQGALLAELAHSRGLAVQEWLTPLGLSPGQMLSPRQLLSMLAALQGHARDVGFVLGQLSLPGHYGLASQALQQATDLRHALRVLCAYAARLSPLLTPRLLETGDELLLVWTEACGAPPALQPLLVDMQMTAVVALAHWLGGQPLRWRFSFNRTRPRELSQHAAYLGTDLQFGCQVDAMRLPLAEALQAWPAAARPSAMAANALAQGADPQALWRGQLAALDDHLLLSLGEVPTLDACARRFNISPATLKRQLALSGTHYQAQLDQVRAQAALYLMALHGQRGEAVARSLGFHDKSNFRRSFRRWTGMTPGML